MQMRAIHYTASLALMFVAACGDDAKNVTPDAGSTGPAVSLSTAGTLGARLVDVDGKALYFFANDVPGANASACTGTGNCVNTWLPFDAATITVGEGLVATDFGRFDRGGGVFQTTWKGRPLYRHVNDATAATTMGEGTGGRWFVARAYNLFFAANATVTPSGGAANAPFLTNGAGVSTYVFQSDTPAGVGTPPISACTIAPCTTNWKIWEKPGALTTPVLPSTMTAADVTFFDNGGKQQFVYKGWPLYFFAADDLPGEVAGAAVANWHAVNVAWDGKFTP